MSRDLEERENESVYAELKRVFEWYLWVVFLGLDRYCRFRGYFLYFVVLWAPRLLVAGNRVTVCRYMG